MRYGTLLSGRGASATDPVLGLFTGGYVGNYIDFRDLSTLFQDTAHTTPVTATGQLIKAAKCKITGTYITVASGMSVELDQVSGKYCAKSFSAPANATQLMKGTIVPSGCGGDSPISLLIDAELSSSNEGYPLVIGDTYASAGTGNWDFIGNEDDGGGGHNCGGGQNGSGYGANMPGYQNGLQHLAFTRGARSGGIATAKFYQGSTLQSTQTLSSAANITTLQLQIGVLAYNGQRFYRAIAINKEVSSAEWAAVLAAF